MRRLKKSELYNGIYVKLSYYPQCETYKIISENNKFYYTVEGADWKIEASYCMDIWCETPETIQLNRNKKLNQIGI